MPKHASDTIKDIALKEKLRLSAAIAVTEVFCLQVVFVSHAREDRMLSGLQRNSKTLHQEYEDLFLLISAI